MSYSDEELQDRIDRGISGDNSADAKAYERLFDILKQEPYQLPADFADRTVRMTESRKSNLVRDYIWFGLGLLSFIIAAIVAASFTSFKPGLGVFTFFSGYPGLVLLAIILVLIFQYLDKRLVKPGVDAGSHLPLI